MSHASFCFGTDALSSQHVSRRKIVLFCPAATNADLMIMACSAVDGTGPAVDLCSFLNIPGAGKIHDRERIILELASDHRPSDGMFQCFRTANHR